jgi:hypothetical protein
MVDNGSVLMFYKEWPTDVGVRPMPYSYGQSIPPQDDIESTSKFAYLSLSEKNTVTFCTQAQAARCQ